MKGLDGELEGRIRGVVANKADLFGEERGVVEGELEEDPALRAPAEEGKRKLGDLMEYVREMERKEMEEGLRAQEDPIWVVPLSAKRRENVAALVQKLADTVKLERERTMKRVEEEERVMEEERAAAVDKLAKARARR